MNCFREQLVKLLGSSERLLLNAPLATKTTFGVGGNADYFVEAKDDVELRGILQICNQNGVKFHILGKGSNTIVKDGGFRGVVIQLTGRWFEKIAVDGTKIECGAGVRLKSLVIEAQRNSIGGFEFLEGIPGTVGGALKMNASAMGSQISDVITYLKIMTYGGDIKEISKEQAGFGYRNCQVLKDAIAIGATFCGIKADKEVIAKKMESFANKRFASQPKYRSAGCVFKNPYGCSAGKIIDELGLKGLMIGGAMISREHGNFIVNVNQAKAKDILELVDKVRKEVKNKHGIDLELEVEVIGED
ncbi:MAG: UDP-N-acetylmuramate dehydrogenase [Verrucomicrobiae bacterium]|nr:UDP-N-acetylmuramate dehydrogenase [Verrucomicrobiae bacterium]